MKCIRCEAENNLQDRTANQGRCRNCNHSFVFEPKDKKNYFKITDRMFAKVIADLSLEDTLFFTPKQLFYLLDSRLKSKSPGIIALIFYYLFYMPLSSLFAVPIVLGILRLFKSYGDFSDEISIGISILISNFFWSCYLFNQSKSPKNNNKIRRSNGQMLVGQGFFIIAFSIFGFFIPITITITNVIGLLLICLGIIRLNQINKNSLKQEFLFTRTKFQQWLTRWQEINGSIEKLLPPPRQQALPATTVNPDVTAYSFDRLLVCDSSTIAQVLIANNFHFENNCAILSVTGYPQSIFEITMEMLRHNPNLQVYALHNCSPKGLSLVHRLRHSPQWFANTDMAVIDIGITPRQILATKRGIFIQSTQESAQAAKELSPAIRQSLSSEEIKWLELGNFVELESFTPKRLIQVLNRCILRANNLTDGDRNLLAIEETSGDLYLVQSFG